MTGEWRRKGPHKHMEDSLELVKSRAKANRGREGCEVGLIPPQGILTTFNGLGE
jgi:hypothetical protein